MNQVWANQMDTVVYVRVGWKDSLGMAKRLDEPTYREDTSYYGCYGMDDSLSQS